jgi:hypothetical protein
VAAKLPFYMVGGACILALAGFGYLEFSSAPTSRDIPLSAEAKAYVHENRLPLTDVTMKATESYALQTLVEIEGKIANTGDRPIDIIEVYCVFSDTYGQMMFRPRVAIVNAKMGGLKPGETKSFRLPFDAIPDSWNQKMPQLVIAAVKFS